jgi:hypothetical protein
MDHPQVRRIGSVQNGYEPDSLLLVGDHPLLELIQGHLSAFDREETRIPGLLQLLQEGEGASDLLDRTGQPVPLNPAPSHESENGRPLPGTDQRFVIEHMFGF